MTLIVAILAVAILLGAFVTLTYFERAGGFRVLSPMRRFLDKRADTFLHVAREADIGALAWNGVRALIDAFVHEVVHVVLVIVRFLERSLTRIAREIRGRRAGENDPRAPFLSGIERLRKAFNSRKQKEQDEVPVE